MGEPQLSDHSVADLLQRASHQTVELVRKEIRLAQAEMKASSRRAGIGGGLMGGAALGALYGMGALVAAAVMLVATALEPWIAAAAVGLAMLVAAGLLALVGKAQARRATPVPERAVASIRQDVSHLKEMREHE